MNGKQLFGGISTFVFAFAVLLLLPAAAAFGQESGPLVHRLSWQPVEYVSRYEVVIEVYARTNSWVEVLRKTSEAETFIDCPLFLGSYRFRVGVYDLLGNPASGTDWVYFEVKSGREADLPPAVQPIAAAEEASVQQALQIAEETRQTTEETHQKIEELAQSMEKISQELEQIRDSAGKGPEPEEIKKTGIGLEIVAQPLIILPFSDFNEIYATSSIQPLGFGLRVSALPFDTSIGVFGFELSPSWNFLANDILVTSRYTHIASAHLSLVWQIRPFSQTTGINFKIGGGITYIKSRFDFNQGSSVVNISNWNPSAAGGVFFIGFLSKQIFFSAGIDYFHIFARDNMSLNYLRPALSLGWLF